MRHRPVWILVDRRVPAWDSRRGTIVDEGDKEKKAPNNGRLQHTGRPAHQRVHGGDGDEAGSMVVFLSHRHNKGVHIYVLATLFNCVVATKYFQVYTAKSS